MGRKVFSALLAVLLLISGMSVSACAELDFTDLIDDLVQQQAEEDKAAENDPERQVGAVLRLADMLAVIASEKESEELAELVEEHVRPVLKDEENPAIPKGEPDEQLANGLMICIDLLSVIAQEFDTEKHTFRKQIEDTVKSVEISYEPAFFPPQQTVSGLYGCVSLLGLIAAENSRGREDTEKMEAIITELTETDERCETVEQQQVNGALRCADLLALIIQELDREEDSRLRDCVRILKALRIGNEQAADVSGQLANALCRCFDLTAVIAYQLTA